MVGPRGPHGGGGEVPRPRLRTDCARCDDCGGRQHALEEGPAARVGPGVARSLLAALHRLPVALFPSAPLADAAFEISLETDRAVYDCLYLALAVARDGVFVTADQKCQRSLRKGRFARYVRWVGEAR